MDSTKNVIDSKKKFQIPEVSKEGVSAEEQAYLNYLKGNPTREEVSRFVEQFVSTVINSINVTLAVFERALVSNNIITEDQFKAAKDEVMKELKENSKETKEK